MSSNQIKTLLAILKTDGVEIILLLSQKPRFTFLVGQIELSADIQRSLAERKILDQAFGNLEKNQ